MGYEMTLLELAVGVAAVMVGILLVRFSKYRPCVFFGHDHKHLSIEIRVWTTGWCGRQAHPIHGNHLDRPNCYVTKFICNKCNSMGYYCIDEEKNGAWKIEHGKIVPDEKAWAQWDRSHQKP